MKGFKDTTKTQFIAGNPIHGAAPAALGLKGAAKVALVMSDFKEGRKK
jgi:hypothetical protein